MEGRKVERTAGDKVRHESVVGEQRGKAVVFGGDGGQSTVERHAKGCEFVKRKYEKRRSGRSWRSGWSILERCCGAKR